MVKARTFSFAGIDEVESSGILSDVLRENNVFLGGSALGKGLNNAARYYLADRLAKAPPLEMLELPAAIELNEDVDATPLEDSFYVIDIGVVVSQVYQWRKVFPRVEPFYAVKCNPDPVIIRALAVLGLNFDCASRNEIRLVQQAAKGLARQPEIVFANPCKSRGHILEAVCKGVHMMTFDNVAEVEKCAAISKGIQLILRIVTDDRGSVCRLSSKFGAPRAKWLPLLAAAKKHGLQVVGVSFHVGSGCRDASRYELALKDAREIFDTAKRDFGFELSLLDIGGGFPGETHSLWNPAMELEDENEQDKQIALEGKSESSDDNAAPEESGTKGEQFMFFSDIAEQVAPMIDCMFPPESGVRVIGEPGRYLVAACSTLCANVIAVRTNQVGAEFEPEPIDDQEHARQLNEMTRDEEDQLVRDASKRIGRSVRSLSSLGTGETENVLSNMMDELQHYSRMYSRQNLTQQEADTYNDGLDMYREGFDTASDILGVPQRGQQENAVHTVEGMNYPLVAIDENENADALVTLASAGEAAVNGIVMQAVADLTPLSDDYAYYINDGVYGAFNNIMFDHATIRPRVLRENGKKVVAVRTEDGLFQFQPSSSAESPENQTLYASTVFGPTCDSIDVVARSVLLPKMQIGDWLYFQNMGAYTMAASSSFNGFVPSEKFYVCSVQPEHFEALIAGPDMQEDEEEKKDEQ